MSPKGAGILVALNRLPQQQHQRAQRGQTPLCPLAFPQFLSLGNKKKNELFFCISLAYKRGLDIDSIKHAIKILSS